jgi:hypothetical protein
LRTLDRIPRNSYILYFAPWKAPIYYASNTTQSENK